MKTNKKKRKQMSEYWAQKKLAKEKKKAKDTKELTYNGVKYRSRSEVRVAKELDAESKEAFYEKTKLSYTVPETKHKYTPDFVTLKHDCVDSLGLHGYILLECKGVGERDGLSLTTRKKMVQVKKDNPDADIRFIFDNPNYKINPKSKTTYAMWAEKNGFPWANRVIPKDWLKEMVYK